MREERTRLAHRNEFLPILTALPCGGTLLPEECKPLLFPRIPRDQSQLINTMIFLMVVRNRQNLAQEVVFGQVWQKPESGAPETWQSAAGIDVNDTP
jgi:hypothetical protein